MTPYSIRRCVLKAAIIGGVILLGAWLSYAQTPTAAPANVLGAKDILQDLRETVDWYRHLRLQEQLATDPSDLTFLDDNRQLAKQILQLSFDSARAEAKLMARQSVPTQAPDPAVDSSAYSGLAKAAAEAGQEVKDTEAELESTKQKAQKAQGAQRQQLQSTVDELQAEITLDRARLDTFSSILQFVQAPGTAGANL